MYLKAIVRHPSSRPSLSLCCSSRVSSTLRESHTSQAAGLIKRRQQLILPALRIGGFPVNQENDALGSSRFQML